jgi:hypothetical protein
MIDGDRVAKLDGLSHGDKLASLDLMLTSILDILASKAPRNALRLDCESNNAHSGLRNRHLELSPGNLYLDILDLWIVVLMHRGGSCLMD